MSRTHAETRTKTTTSSSQQPRPLTRPAHPAAIIQRARAAPESLSRTDVLQRTIGRLT